MMKIEEIIIYPVKSLRGISLSEAKIEKRGLEYDRRWMLTHLDGRFISQREFPVLSRIEVQIEGENLAFRHLDEPTRQLRVPAVPLEKGPLLHTEVWGKSATALPVSKEAEEWFGKLLGLPCRLVYMPDNSLRPINPAYAEEGEIVSFADGYPLLGIGTATLADLNGRLEKPIDMSRFRPNLVFSSEVAFDEDKWKHFTIGTVNFRGVRPCARCIMTTVNPDKGVKEGAEPVKTLATYRKVNNKIYFGMNMIWQHAMDAEAGLSMIHIGDSIEVLSRHEEVIYA